jgi:hypothetical protein
MQCQTLRIATSGILVLQWTASPYPTSIFMQGHHAYAKSQSANCNEWIEST